jgi:predicted PurR-regulated permease PerM
MSAGRSALPAPSSSWRGYMAVRSVLGLAAAVLNYLLLLLAGVDHAVLWAVPTP